MDMLKRLVTASSLVATILVVLMLYSTTPTGVGPLGIFALFVLLYLSVLGVLTYLLLWLSGAVAKLALLASVKRPINALTFQRAYYFSSILTLVPIMLIGLHSVGEVGFYEVFLVTIFGVVGCLYIAKRTS